MIQEVTLTKRVQTPTPPNEWCFQDQGENFRYFTKRVLLGKNEHPWAECTNDAKLAWGEANSQAKALVKTEGAG